jgi:actin-like ATPase involved in cell morphogenesis
MTDPAIAIDFGTTRTKIAFFDERRGAARLIELGRDQRSIIPSVFYLPTEGATILVGDEAQEMAESDPEGIVIGLKREIHKRGKIRRGPGREAIERDRLAAHLFAHIRRKCQDEVYHGLEVVRCCLTVPAAFGEPQREAVRRAAEFGGFKSITIIEEPVAAAMAWLSDAGQNVADCVLVCDVGGGTTDFALVRLVNGCFRTDEIVAPAGFLGGGNDIDQNIWNEMMASAESKAPALSQLSSAFLIKLRRIRERLTRDHKADNRATIAGQSLVINRGIVERDVKAFVEKVSEETRRYADKCADAGAPNTPILLTGGGSQMPELRKALEDLKRGPVYVWHQSEYATVLGAVEIPQKPAGSSNPAWDKYGEAVKLCWLDKEISPAEAEHLREQQRLLSISAEVANQIERRFLDGATLDETIRTQAEVKEADLARKLETEKAQSVAAEAKVRRSIEKEAAFRKKAEEEDANRKEAGREARRKEEYALQQVRAQDNNNLSVGSVIKRGWYFMWSWIMLIFGLLTLLSGVGVFLFDLLSGDANNNPDNDHTPRAFIICGGVFLLVIGGFSLKKAHNWSRLSRGK